jgi:hypothetical protein
MLEQRLNRWRSASLTPEQIRVAARYAELAARRDSRLTQQAHALRVREFLA